MERQTSSRNLVVVRAGAESLHPRWFTPDREFDLVVDAWSGGSQQYAGTCDELFSGLAETWSLAWHRLFTEHPRLLQDYDAVWIPGDDIDTTAATINTLFRLHHELGFDLSQPALTPDSYFGHSITLRHEGISVRETNFVETMAPMFTTQALSSVLDTFAATRSARCLDYVWPEILTPLGARYAIFDCLPVRHTRPVEGKQGLPEEEAEADAIRLVTRFGVSPGTLTKKVLKAYDDAYQRVPQHQLYPRLVRGFPRETRNPVRHGDFYYEALATTATWMERGVLA